MSGEATNSWIYIGALSFELTEGDVICFCSQYGEVSEISLARDKDTGKSRGFCFLKYEDPRSCELAVDNLHGSTIVGRKIKVSYANNLNAINSRKANNVAPQIEPDCEVKKESEPRERRERRDTRETDDRKKHHKSHKHDRHERKHHHSSRHHKDDDYDERRSHRHSHRHHRRRSYSRSRSR